MRSNISRPSNEPAEGDWSACRACSSGTPRRRAGREPCRSSLHRASLWTLCTLPFLLFLDPETCPGMTSDGPFVVRLWSVHYCLDKRIPEHGHDGEQPDLTAEDHSRRPPGWQSRKTPRCRYPCEHHHGPRLSCESPAVYRAEGEIRRSSGMQHGSMERPQLRPMIGVRYASVGMCGHWAGTGQALGRHCHRW